MKQSVYYFFIMPLLSLSIMNFAMEKEEPSDNSFFSKPISLLTSLFNKKEDKPTELLVTAIKKQDVPTLKTALEQGGDCNTTIYNESRKINLLPLHYAVQYNYPKMVKILLDAGAKPFAHQSLIALDTKDIFPLSLLPLATKLSEKYKRLAIIELFAKNIKEKKLKTEYFNFTVHVRMLTENYNYSENNYSSAAAHIKDQLEIVKMLNTYIINLNNFEKSELIPKHKDIFHLLKFMVKDYYKDNLAHPMVQLYNHLKNPLKDYENIALSINAIRDEYSEFQKAKKDKQKETENLINFSEWDQNK